MMNQREAVFQAVQSVVGEIDGAVELNREQRQEVYATLIEGFTQGKIELKGDRSLERVQKYVPGLLNNWLRKDTRLNGGEKYVPKNPGSRLGAGDPTLKALRDLLKATNDPAIRADIEKEIEARKAVLKPKVSIDIDALPEHLQDLARQVVG